MTLRRKQHLAWHRELLKWWMDNAMPTRCEICNDTFGLALAHSKKRRFIDTKELYFETAALCQKCHETVEFSGHEEMERRIKEIIAKRPQI